jgi:hypothetical protein
MERMKRNQREDVAASLYDPGYLEVGLVLMGNVGFLGRSLSLEGADNRIIIEMGHFCVRNFFFLARNDIFI